MPRKRLPMRKINEVLRLKAAGLSVREIARSTGAARTTVYEYLVRADGAGLTWPLPDDMDDDALEAKLFPPATAELAERRPLPDWRAVHRELRRGRHVTLRLLWLEWKQDHPDGWGYSQYCWHYHRWLGAQDVVMRLNYPPGARMFVDYSGDKVPVVDAGTGEVCSGRGLRSRAGLFGHALRRGIHVPGPAELADGPCACLRGLRRGERGHYA